MSETEVTDQVRAARNLREIVRLDGHLRAQVYFAAVNRDVSNLDALNYFGPAANPEAWENVYQTATDTAARDDVKFIEYADDQVGRHHPLFVLASWSDIIRDQRDEPTDLRATVKREADYIGEHLDWIYGDDGHSEPNFWANDELSDDLSKCRATLEGVLKDGVRHDTSAAACFNDDAESDTGKCGGQLIRRTLKRDGCEHETLRRQVAEWAARPERKGEREHPGVTMEFVRALNPAVFADHVRGECDLGGRDDVYQCRKCHRRYDEAGYWLAVMEHYERQAG